MPTDLSPTARALRAIEILQTRPGVTADELAACLGVTERAARRYVGILREASIPVESARGPYGGYRLGRGTRLPPVVFTEPEAVGLVMAVLDGQPAAADVDDLVGSALSKVIRALPESVGRQAAALREHASAAPDRYSTRPDPATTSALVAAIAARRRVLVTYRSESGNEWKAEVDPWAVVVRYGRWYLVCHSHRADAIRTYRVDRVRAVQQTAHEFEPPDGLDPVAALEENLGAGWEFPTRVVFDAPWARWPRGSGLPWDGLNHPETGACSSAARAIRRCTRRSGWRACRSPSASMAGKNSVPRSRRSLRVSLPPWRTNPDSAIEARATTSRRGPR
ncbi:MAG: helix-turn-helix, type 11, partial [Acidimicrobiales bacterium]|nr:helix-turn-helix, type 11 [Acidimicrobiales bacterium]